MKKILFVSICLIGNNLLCQSSSLNNLWTAPKYLGFDATNGTNPLFTKTNNFNRTKLNGNLSYAVNGFTDVRNGYMLLSPWQNGGKHFILFPLF